MLASKLLSCVGGEETLYSSDVFSAYTYTGTGATQAINNGIDLAGKGGLVWIKDRTSADTHILTDTVRGVGNSLQTASTAASVFLATGLTSFNSDGFSIGSSTFVNRTTDNLVSWTFAKSPKFLDIVTWTGTGVSVGEIKVHALTQSPGTVWVKRTDSTSDWLVWHRGCTSGNFLKINTTDAQSTLLASTYFGNGTTTVDPTSTGITVGLGLNAMGGTYVAYVFGHDTSLDGLIQCGSFTTDGSGNATVNLGWEPQFTVIKAASGAGSSWHLSDSARGYHTKGGANSPFLLTDYSNAENITAVWSPTSNGFTHTGYLASTTFIYLAIRRSNKPPTLGTQVYNSIARTGTGAAATVTGVGFAPDLVIAKQRTDSLPQGRPSLFADRLRGGDRALYADQTSAEDTSTFFVRGFLQDGVSLDAGGSVNTATNSPAYINHFFKRAVGVFDEVCYTGNSSTVPGGDVSITHGLGVVPELAIVKIRGIAGGWCVGNAVDWAKTLMLNETSAYYTGANNQAFTSPTASVLNVRNNNVQNLNANTYTYVAYLFATKAGISKVFSYTGNGTSQTIDCGFTTGCRFFLVKSTSTTGNWWVYDTARGIVSSTDFALALNSTAAEITSTDAVDPHVSGIIVNQEATCSINASGVSYIYLAYA